MKSDPGVERARAARSSISREAGHDPAKLVAYYLEFQKRFASRVRYSSPRAQAERLADDVRDGDAAPGRR